MTADLSLAVSGQKSCRALAALANQRTRRSRQGTAGPLAWPDLERGTIRTEAHVITRLAYRMNLWLEPWFPEQRMFLKSDTTTRFVRLRPLTLAVSAAVGVLAVSWATFATSILLMDFVNSGSSREQVQRPTTLFEQRLNTLSDDRDLRVTEAASAQQHFNLALGQVSAMQERLLASDTRLRELETGIDVIQNTLRRSIRERDEARGEVAQARVALNQLPGAHTAMGETQDLAATLDVMANALTDTAKDRDAQEADVVAEQARTAAVAKQKAQVEARNSVIFGKLEQALTVSVEPLEKMFKAAGLNPDDLISAVKSGYSGQGGPLSPISFSTMGLSGSPDETRANAILQGLDELNMYRIAAFKVPLGLPLHTTFRLHLGLWGAGRSDQRVKPYARGAGSGWRLWLVGLRYRRWNSHIRRLGIGLWPPDQGPTCLRNRNPLRPLVADRSECRGKGIAWRKNR